MATKNQTMQTFPAQFDVFKQVMWPSKEMVSAVPGFEVAMEAGARCQSAMLCLMSQRMQEYLRIPERLAACHSPQDLASLHLGFWQTAWQQYSEAGQTMMAQGALPECASRSAKPAAASGGDEGKKTADASRVAA